ncbi:ParB/RepB/Spo0J family partition protein [Schaalia georgiae]|uniref:ParB/RepB/Spo0J family partition protein n=1 Tax=Schaalia georgiae TaxID=52768 RepID=UPI00055709F5|nr:ParB/RepB/Spo0J family partition protein [Schaalia georgiae]
MADVQKSGGVKRGRKHAGLGRGLGALIPPAQDTDTPSQTPMPKSSGSPLDVFFPEGSTRQRGGSAKELLQPKQRPSSLGKKRSPAKRAESPRQATPAKGGVEAGAPPSKGKDRVPSAGSDRVLPKERPASGTSSSSVSRETLEEVELLPVPGASFAEVPVDQIVPNAKQPREIFDEDDLAELAASIKEVGVLQPVVVRPIPDGKPEGRLKEYLAEKPEAKYELIMGERRLRASQLAGETTIPAIIRQTDDSDLLRDALLENLHRAQLNPLEEASAYQQLMADFGATQEELAKRIARSRPQIANTLRLLKLPPAVQKKVAAQVISAGHARALLALPSAEEMERLADRIVTEGLSVRTTEELVRLGKIKAGPKPRARKKPQVSALGESVVTALQDVYETRVTITEGRKKGKIVIEFAGSDDLQRIADLILRH